MQEIFFRTYGESKRQKQQAAGETRRVIRPKEPDPRYLKKKEEDYDAEYLLVDGYNIIFAWEELNELAKVNIDGARYRLMDILCNYQGYKKCILIVVFDAYKVTGNIGSASKYHNINVVYTKEAETADQYIEKLAHKIEAALRNKQGLLEEYLPLKAFAFQIIADIGNIPLIPLLSRASSKGF